MSARSDYFGMADRDRDEDTGRFTTEFEDEDFIRALEELGGSASTSDIAEQLDCDRRTAYLRLNDLEDAGCISSREVGNSLLWMGE
jgi:uncharacterized membrane protein